MANTNQRKTPRLGTGALSPQATADRWGKSRQHIYNLIGDGTLRSFKVGRSRLISIKEIERIEQGGDQ